MAININTGFKLLNEAESLDSRCLYKTVAEMADATVGIYEGCIAYVSTGDEKGYYTFNKNNDLDPTLGLWRPLQLGGGGDVIADDLDESLTKTYSITKIKNLLNKNGGYVLVDVLPDLTDEAQRESVELNKIYLVPNGDAQDENKKDEYICVYVEGGVDVYREALVTSDTDYDTWKTEIEGYVTGGGSLDDDFATYTTTNTTTTMTEVTYAEMIESINASDADYDSYVARVTAIIVTPATAESWAWERFGSLSGDAGLVWEEDTIVSNPVGKVKMNDNLVNKSVLEVVTRMLQEDIPTTISLVGSPSATALLEKHVASITDVALTATISLGTGTIEDGADIIFKKDGVAIDTQAYVSGTSVYTYTETGANVTEDTTYSVEVKYDMDGVEKTATTDIKYTFVLPLFWGVSSTKEIADISALTKVVESKGTKKYTYSVSNGYCVLAVPTPYSVTKIVDQNGFDNTSSFDVVEQVATIGAENITYRVYTNTNPCTTSGFTYTFTVA